MCGIAGFVEANSRAADRLRLEAMLPPIAHRGPDDSGTYLDGSVALGHRRLSIIDLSEHGHQPMPSRDGETWIILNGEIYNFPELRAQLPDPEDYRGSSDTEVLIRAYETWGQECLSRLNGMFSFAIYDRRKRTIFLARDRMGIKPLYWARDDHRFYFGSEVKSFIAAGLEPEFDRIAGLDWIHTGWTTDHRWLLKNVRRVPPGHCGTFHVETGKVEWHRYYEPSPHTGEHDPLPRGKALDDLIDDELAASVKRRMISDVPVGTYCSGGIDSSLLTAMAARNHDGLHAFNVSTPDSPEDDENAYANQAARHVGVELHTYSLTRSSFRDNLIDAIHVTEYPLTYSNTVPLMMVSQLAREQGVIVVLSGEGADELFGGYVSYFKYNALERAIRALPWPLSKLGKKFLAKLDGFYSRIGGSRPQGLATPGFDQALLGHLRTFDLELRTRAHFDHYDPLDRELAGVTLAQLQNYLLPILHRTDRASMFASIEARTPFLDHNFVELALRVPPDQKVQFQRGRPHGKSILKRIAARYLPEDLVYRPKMGFQTPFSYYSGEWPRNWTEEGFLATEYALVPDQLRQWLGSLNNQTLFMALAMEIWGQLYVYRRDRLEIQEEFLATS